MLNTLQSRNHAVSFQSEFWKDDHLWKDMAK